MKKKLIMYERKIREKVSDAGRCILLILLNSIRSSTTLYLSSDILLLFTIIIRIFQCGEKGHYANRCHKGLLAFLSNTAYLAHEQREKDEKEAR